MPLFPHSFGDLAQSFLLWNFRCDGLWGGCWGPRAVGRRFHQHNNVYVCPQLCKIYMKGIKTKLTAGDQRP